MEWDIEYTNEFELWLAKLTKKEQIAVTTIVNLLKSYGPNHKIPASICLNSSKLKHMRELHIEYAGSPYQIFYVFDLTRFAILLLSGNKIGEEVC
ncbi:type II toxin-antitoxin system RelE/ParE family toxin [Legionella anisa]|nr:type II toxin-antitoxin system RelE/ParE family toxin [Legionella anisa]KTC70075.1 hypothetical protein Lani_2416 [Legionella anisa]UAK81419.1 type II toxin-antitoxin system RelE/ParE family toxin [Legionella anisa]